MIKVIGVRFRKAGKVYYFDPLDIIIEEGQHVIVETIRGIEYGEVVFGVKELPNEEIIQPLKPVIRVSTPEDDKIEADNKSRESEAFDICLKKIEKHGLDMKLIDCEFTFDNNKLLFYFTADGRIDFRELVKDLAAIFKTRIELRQIGVRDETKMVGGIGICGRPLCCNTHLCEFQPVSIKMAKEQNLSLNPTKISGVCGRLMCCLKYEEATYESLNENLPNIGDIVITFEEEVGEVISVNVLRQLVKIIVRKEDGDTDIKQFKAEEVTIKKQAERKTDEEISREELEELKRLEKMEKKEVEMKRE